MSNKDQNQQSLSSIGELFQDLLNKPAKATLIQDYPYLGYNCRSKTLTKVDNWINMHKKPVRPSLSLAMIQGYNVAVRNHNKDLKKQRRAFEKLEAKCETLEDELQTTTSELEAQVVIHESEMSDLRVELDAANVLIEKYRQEDSHND